MAITMFFPRKLLYRSTPMTRAIYAMKQKNIDIMSKVLPDDILSVDTILASK